MLLAAGLWLWRRPPSAEPVFVIEEALVIDAAPERVWAVLADTDRYPQWNPYLEAWDGSLEPGAAVKIRLAQDDWENPRTIRIALQTIDAGRELRWTSTAGAPVIGHFDHGLRLVPEGSDATRLVHREEFRGWIAQFLGAAPERTAGTRRAFVAMNRALARRVAEAGRTDSGSENR